MGPPRSTESFFFFFFESKGDGLTGNSGVVLEKVCEYFLYNEKNKEQSNVPDMEIPSELCLELLMAADYLDSEFFFFFFFLRIWPLMLTLLLSLICLNMYIAGLFRMGMIWRITDSRDTALSVCLLFLIC